MSTKRKTGKDYNNEYWDLWRKQRSLDAKVNERLLELVKQYPDVDLPTSRAGEFKCKNINHPWIIEDITTTAKIGYIEAIEKYIADQHPHKQTKIEGF